MDLKEEIDKRQKAGYSKKEIVSFLKQNGFSQDEIDGEYPKLKSTNTLYRVMLVVSFIFSLAGIALIFPFFGVLSIFSPVGIMIVALCYATYAMYRLEKPGFIIYMSFYGLIICGALIAYGFFQDDLYPFSSFIYLIFIISLFSFFIRSLYSLYKKI
ncbi:MAG: hypothetical protein R2797_12040 [Gelidibacter sp.]